MEVEYNFEDHGFIIQKKCFESKDLREVQKLTDEIIEYSIKNLEDPFQNYYLRHRTDRGILYDLFQRHPEFQDLAKNKTILDCLETVIGTDIFLYENSLVYKPKNKTNEVPWHQDFINRVDEPRKFVAWIALDKITLKNGAMKLIPGSHKLGFLDYYTIPGEAHHTRLKLDGVNLSSAISVELEMGDVLIFNQLVIHSSSQVNSDLKRRAYRVSYQGFEELFAPRGTPIVLRGGHPNSLAQKYSNSFQVKPSQVIPVQKSIIHKSINRIGHKLANL